MGKKRKGRNKEYDSNHDFIYNDYQAQNEGPQIRKKFHVKDLRNILPKTRNQNKFFDFWKSNEQSQKSLFLYGSAGTGKTFLSLYSALHDILDNNHPEYEKIIIVRSIVSVRDVGFLPGDLDEKIAVYEEPYASICDELFPWKKAYENLKKIGKIQFMPTSFLRGATFNNTIIIVDETQNMTFQELDTIITRVGENSKIIFCGDRRQSDLVNKRYETSGFNEFIKIIEKMPDYFETIEFNKHDIVRSGLVKDYILQKEEFIAN